MAMDAGTLRSPTPPSSASRTTAPASSRFSGLILDCVKSELILNRTDRAHQSTYSLIRITNTYFQMTYLEGYWELEEILADLAFSAKVHFLYQLLSKNIYSEKSFRGSKYVLFELRCKLRFMYVYLIYEMLCHSVIVDRDRGTWCWRAGSSGTILRG